MDNSSALGRTIEIAEGTAVGRDVGQFHRVDEMNGFMNTPLSFYGGILAFNYDLRRDVKQLTPPLNAHLEPDPSRQRYATPVVVGNEVTPPIAGSLRCLQWTGAHDANVE